MPASPELPPPDTPAAAPRSRFRSVGWPIGALLVVAAVIAIIQSPDWPQPANVNIASLALILLWLWGAGRWMRRASGWSLATRRRIVGGGVAVLIAAVALLRFEGFRADLIPVLTPRWRPSTPSGGPVEQGGGRANLQSTANDYPQFLGPERRGVLAGPNLAADWTKSPPRLLWRRPLGPGWSSFAVVGDYAITQQQLSTDGVDLESVSCFELRTGKLVWTHSDPAIFSEILGGVGPRATPTVHNGRVYTQGATGILNCLDGATGKPLWSLDLVKQFGASMPTWGFANSPLIIDNTVVVATGAIGKSLVALDQLTGKVVWATSDDPISYSSPTLGVLHGRRQILLVSAASVAGYEPSSGAVIWRYDWPAAMGQPTVPQPVVVGSDRVLITKGYGVGATMLEISAPPTGSWTAKRLWDNNELKTKFSNVVIRDGFVYGIDERLLECVDLATGKRIWRTGRRDDFAYGQILLVGDKLLILAESGSLALVAADPQGFKELARFPLFDSKTWNNPVLAGRYLVARSDREAACLELPTLASDGEKK